MPKALSIITEVIRSFNKILNNNTQAHTDARQFMTRPIPYYKDLCMICDSSFDERDWSSGQDLEQQNDEAPRSCGGLNSIHSPAASVSSEDNVGDVLESDHTCQKNKRQLEDWPNVGHSKRARDKDEGVASALREMATAVSSLSDKKKNDENSISIENVIEAVQALTDMDEDLVLDACDFLEDEKKAKTFMTLDVKLRKKWLLRKLRPQA